MKTFYKIEEGKLQIGSGELIPESFIEYEVGKEPQELIDALESEAKEQELQSKIQEANAYLLKTDWVTSYKLKHDIGLELIPSTSSKWDIIKKRESFINYLKGLS